MEEVKKKYIKSVEKSMKEDEEGLEKGYLKKETETTIVAAQDQALCTRNMRNVVWRKC